MRVQCKLEIAVVTSLHFYNYFFTAMIQLLETCMVWENETENDQRRLLLRIYFAWERENPKVIAVIKIFQGQF